MKATPARDRAARAETVEGGAPAARAEARERRAATAARLSEPAVGIQVEPAATWVARRATRAAAARTVAARRLAARPARAARRQAARQQAVRRQAARRRAARQQAAR